MVGTDLFFSFAHGLLGYDLQDPHKISMSHSEEAP